MRENRYQATLALADAAEASVSTRLLAWLRRLTVTGERYELVVPDSDGIVRALASLHARAARMTRVPQSAVSKAVDRSAFAAVNQASVIWAREKVAKLITEITTTARQTVRETVAEGITTGRTVEQIGRQLRLVVGLTTRDALLISRFIDENRQLKRELLEARATRLAAKKLNARARLIARTEVMEATNAGQVAAWKNAAASGLLDESLMKEFIATADACPTCAALDGERVPVNSAFSFGKLNPPVHPACRCAVGLVEVRKVGRKAA